MIEGVQFGCRDWTDTLGRKRVPWLLVLAQASELPEYTFPRFRARASRPSTRPRELGNKLAPGAPLPSLGLRPGSSITRPCALCSIVQLRRILCPVHVFIDQAVPLRAVGVRSSSPATW